MMLLLDTVQSSSWQRLVYLPAGVLASVLLWVWWPKSESQWRRWWIAWAAFCGYLTAIYVLFGFRFP